MRAYILSIGSELLLGQLTDTNATFLAQELSAAGIDLVHVTHVGDDRTQLVDAIRHALSRAEFVICSGGVGPTDDDLTREAIAEVVDETPEIDPELLADLIAFFGRRGTTMPERNKKQAWTIPSATTLPNPVGTAPGWFVQTSDLPPKVIVAMPGVPREMFRMWSEQALPRIQERAGQRIIDSIIVKTIGIGESACEQELHDLVLAADPVVATYAKDDGVHVRITAMGNDAAETRARRDAGETEVRSRLADYIWGTDRETLPTVLARLIAATGGNLGVTERGTGGGFTALLTSNPESVTCLAGSRILPLIETGDAGIHERLADDARCASRLDGASLGISAAITGRLEPSGLVEGELHVVVAYKDQEPVQLRGIHLRSTLPEVQRRSGLHVADVLRRHLLTAHTSDVVD